MAVALFFLLFFLVLVGQASVAFTAVTRLPMVAGWDRMLPTWFSRLHPRYATPVNSILLVGATSFAIAALSLVGVGHAEAFQLLFNASGIFYALCYVVMFALPLVGLKGVSPRPPLWLRLASLSGLPADDLPQRGGAPTGGLPGVRLPLVCGRGGAHSATARRRDFRGVGRAVGADRSTRLRRSQGVCRPH